MPFGKQNEIVVYDFLSMMGWQNGKLAGELLALACR
jgi:hypothetical protein